MIPTALDTSPESHAAQEAAYVAMGPAGRLRTALQMSEVVRKIRLAGLRHQWPEAAESELIRRFILEVHGVG